MPSALSRFIKNLLLLLLLIIVADYIIGKWLEYAYFHIQSGTEYKTIYVMGKAKEDMVLLGSSRAYHHYQPHILENKLGRSIYNGGRDGAGLLYHYAMYQQLRKNGHTKAILLDMTIDELDKRSVTYEHLNALAPFYNRYPEVRSLLQLRSPYEPIKLKSSLYRFNSLPFYIAVYNRSSDDAANKGFKPLHNKLNTSLGTLQPSAYTTEVDTVLLNYFKQLLKEVKNDKVELYVCISPYYIRIPYPTPSMKKMKELCLEANIPFMDFSNHPAFMQHPGLFNEPIHLNEDGAIRYSHLLADTLSKLSSSQSSFH